MGGLSLHDPLMVEVLFGGMALGTGVFLALTGLRRRPARLDDALAQLAGSTDRLPELVPGASQPRQHDGDLATRLGEGVFRRLHLPLTDGARHTLALQGRSIGDFFAQKVVLASVGLAMPLLLATIVTGMAGLVAPLPVALSLGLALAGWFAPNLLLRRDRRDVHADAGEALFTFLDLVTLERMANASAPQALARAAAMSDIPLYLRLRSALERARLEQRPPWQELRRLSHDLDIPQIADVADVMRLDEQGAALAETLRARVQELRDAHLLEEKLAAQQVSERMTLWMVLPSMVFGLVFLTPPILKLMGLG